MFFYTYYCAVTKANFNSLCCGLGICGSHVRPTTPEYFSHIICHSCDLSIERTLGRLQRELSCALKCGVLWSAMNFVVWDAWCNGSHVCFPSLPPMLLCGFESRLGLESSGLSMWHFLKLVARGFLRTLRFPPLLHRLMVQPINKAKINAIYTLSNLIAELSLRTTWHVTQHVALNVLRMICTWLRSDHVLETVHSAMRRL